MAERRVALITGAASGIGNATSALLRSNDYAVAMVDLHAPDVVSDDVLPLAADVSRRNEVQNAVEHTVRRFGRLDVLVTCAGHLELVPLTELSEETLERMLAVHLKGTIYSVQSALPAMQSRGYGRIVCISSLAARKPVVTHSHYAAAKAGIIGFTRTAAREIGRDGITINCVLPGAIETPMLGTLTAEERAAMSNNAVGRIGTPDDIAHAVRFLTSPEAGFITGTTLLVSGGDFT